MSTPENSYKINYDLYYEVLLLKNMIANRYLRDILWLHVSKSIGSLKMLKKPFSLICLLLLHLKDLSFIFIHLDFVEISPFLNRTMAPMAATTMII